MTDRAHYNIEKFTTERPCFCDPQCWDHWVEETVWEVTDDATGFTVETYDRRKDAIGRANYDGATWEVIK